jgi:hypothetical protein
MAGPIYKVAMFKSTEAMYRLSDEERQALLGKVMAAMEKYGGRSVLLCDSSWSSEQWPWFVVEEWPDLEALQKYTQALQELNWSRYSECMTVLGTKR